MSATVIRTVKTDIQYPIISRKKMPGFLQAFEVKYMVDCSSRHRISYFEIKRLFLNKIDTIEKKCPKCLQKITKFVSPNPAFAKIIYSFLKYLLKPYNGEKNQRDLDSPSRLADRFKKFNKPQLLDCNNNHTINLDQAAKLNLSRKNFVQCPVKDCKEYVTSYEDNHQLVELLGFYTRISPKDLENNPAVYKLIKVWYTYTFYGLETLLQNKTMLDAGLHCPTTGLVYEDPQIVDCTNLHSINLKALEKLPLPRACPVDKCQGVIKKYQPNKALAELVSFILNSPQNIKLKYPLYKSSFEFTKVFDSNEKGVTFTFKKKSDPIELLQFRKAHGHTKYVIYILCSSPESYSSLANLLHFQGFEGEITRKSFDLRFNGARDFMSWMQFFVGSNEFDEESAQALDQFKTEIKRNIKSN